MIVNAVSCSSSVSPPKEPNSPVVLGDEPTAIGAHQITARSAGTRGAIGSLFDKYKCHNKKLQGATAANFSAPAPSAAGPAGPHRPFCPKTLQVSVQV